MKYLTPILLTLLLLPVLTWSDEPRADVLSSALAYWQLGSGGTNSPHALARHGEIETAVPAEGEGARGDEIIARANRGYFDAGPGLNVTGTAITVFLRVRDPYGQWMHALMAKRGSHDSLNFNLFSADLDRSQGPDIGFEIHTEQGLIMAGFPVSEIHPQAWHNLVARYDGRRVELICDGVVMDRLRWTGSLTRNDEPLLIGAQTDSGKTEASFAGELSEAAIWARALSDDEVAQLCRVDRVTSHPKAPEAAEPYRSPIHFRPVVGKMGDTIPFYWNGQYHVYYLRAVARMPWDHIVSTDLVHWTQLPVAIVPDGDPAGPCGENIGTGSIIEKNGTFHAFFTGWNPRNPQGREVAGHAVSSNLLDWVKYPESAAAPDGVVYKNTKDRDFRDPFVFWNEADQKYWMLVYANDAKSGGTVIAVFTSTDLDHWTTQPPIANLTGQECPDYFTIGDTHYLLGGFRYAFARDVRGPYLPPDNPYLDTPILYAGKRMFDGKRHVWTAWFRDLGGEHDNGAMEWGGSQCLPRELYAGPGGELYMKPVDEVSAVFNHTDLDFATNPPPSAAATWSREGGVLIGRAEAAGSQQTYAVPDHYMLTARIELDPGADFSMVFREERATGDGYRLLIRPAAGEAEIGGRSFRYPRRCRIDASKPISIQAFVQGTMIETFINEQYAFSCRAYDYPHGLLGLNVSRGSVRILDLKVKTIADAGPKS